MKKTLYALFTILVCTSCASSYSIQGSSSIANLDGEKLYLKVMQDADVKNIDSCDVVHGQFVFTGTIDTVRIASLFMNDIQVRPIVLEQGDITMHIDYTSYDVKGTQLNDRMTTFLNESNKIQSQLRELGQEEYEGYANNKDMDEVYSSINKKMAALDDQYEKLLTKFVEDNFDNVLGPWAFSLYAIRYQYPMLDDWIEFIMSKATEKFKNDPIIRDYYEAALKNQNIMNGTETPVSAEPLAPAPGTTSDAAEAPKTPAELAGDTTKR